MGRNFGCASASSAAGSEPATILLVWLGSRVFVQENA